MRKIVACFLALALPWAAACGLALRNPPAARSSFPAAGGVQRAKPPAAAQKGRGVPQQPERLEVRQPCMGTTFRLVLYAGDRATAEKAAKAAFARAAELDQVMSDYKQDSELMRLCRKAGGDPVKVSPDLFKVLERAQKISEWSGGAF